MLLMLLASDLGATAMDDEHHMIQQYEEALARVGDDELRCIEENCHRLIELGDERQRVWFLKALIAVEGEKSRRNWVDADL